MFYTQAEAHQVTGLGQVPLQQPPSSQHRSPLKSTLSTRSVDKPGAVQLLSEPSSSSPVQHSKPAANTPIEAGCDPDGYWTTADVNVVMAAIHNGSQHQAVLHVQSGTVSACDPDRYCNIAPLSAEAAAAHIGEPTLRLHACKQNSSFLTILPSLGASARSTYCRSVAM